MRIEEVPRDAWSRLVDALLDHLGRHSGGHTSALFRVELLDDDPALGVRDGILFSTDDAAEGILPEGDFSSQSIALFEACKMLGKPLHMASIKFRRHGSEWNEIVGLESLDEWRRLETERKSLDQSVARVMVEATGGDWRRISFGRRDISPASPLRLQAFYTTGARALLAIPQSLSEFDVRVKALYASHSREILAFTYSVKPGLNSPEVDVYYV